MVEFVMVEVSMVEVAAVQLDRSELRWLKFQWLKLHQLRSPVSDEYFRLKREKKWRTVAGLLVPCFFFSPTLLS